MIIDTLKHLKEKEALFSIFKMKKQTIDGFEAHPCMEIPDIKGNYVEQCEPEEAHFWSVYMHYRDGGLEYLADCICEEDAHTLADFLQSLCKNFKAFEL